MGHTITVSHVAGDHFSVDIRGHRLDVDQPKATPDLEAGPTPVELLVAALASCAAHAAQLVLARLDSAASVTATCEYEMSQVSPWRVEFVHVTLVLPRGLTEQRVASIRRAVDQCTVHQSLRQPFAVVVSLLSDPREAPAMTPANADAAAIMSHAGLTAPTVPSGLR